MFFKKVNVKKLCDEKWDIEFKVVKKDVWNSLKIFLVDVWKNETVGVRGKSNKWVLNSFTNATISNNMKLHKKKTSGIKAFNIYKIIFEILERLLQKKWSGFQKRLVRMRWMTDRICLKKRDKIKELLLKTTSASFIVSASSSLVRWGGVLQRLCYYVYKKIDCLIYQTVTTMIGLLFQMYGPEAGKREELMLCVESVGGVMLEAGMVINGKISVFMEMQQNSSNRVCESITQKTEKLLHWLYTTRRWVQSKSLWSGRKKTDSTLDVSSVLARPESEEVFYWSSLQSIKPTVELQIFTLCTWVDEELLWYKTYRQYLSYWGQFLAGTYKN